MNAHPEPPPPPKPEPMPERLYLIEPWTFRKLGRALLWVVPGYTHYYGYPN